MRRSTRGSLWLALLLCLGTGLAAGQASGAKVVDDGLVIQDVTLISPERRGPLHHADVVIRDGRIAQIGAGLVPGPHARRIDGRGRFLIPGLIDSHVHVGSTAPLDDDAIAAHPELLQAFRAQLPRSYLAFGFTTLVDLDLRPGTLSWFNAGPLHPSLYHCGRAVHIAGGYGALQPRQDAAAAQAANLVYEPGQAQDWPATVDPRDFTPAHAVERVAEAGGICVKAFVEPGFGEAFHWPVPRPVTLAALRAEARRRRLVFVVHANAVESWRAALDARADVIAHGLWHWPGELRDTTPPREARAVIRAAARARVGVQPTLQTVYGDESVFDDSGLDDPRMAFSLPGPLLGYLRSRPAQASRRALADQYRQMIAQFLGPTMDGKAAMAIAPARATATLRLMQAGRVKLLFGTDTGASEGIGNPPGLNGRLELQRWFEAGVPLPRILRAATLDNAIALGLSDRGAVEVGRRADLLLLHEDPLRSVAAYDAIDIVFLNGEPVPRETLRPQD